MKQSINSICKSILEVPDAEIAQLERIADEQMQFFSPLRMATNKEIVSRKP